MVDEKVEQYRLLRPHKYAIVELMQFCQPVPEDRTYTQASLSLILRCKDNKDERRLHLSFSGVTEFIFQPFVSPAQFTRLFIESLHDRQWEHIKYRVANLEQDTGFSFYCVDFTAELVGRMGLWGSVVLTLSGWHVFALEGVSESFKRKTRLPGRRHGTRTILSKWST